MGTGRRLTGVVLTVLGLAVALPFLAGVLIDLFGDNYPDTWRDHLRELAFVAAGFAVAAYGARRARAGRAPGTAWTRTGGALLALAALGGALFYTFICGFGCSPAEYTAGIALLALAGAAGLVLATRPGQRETR